MTHSVRARPATARLFATFAFVALLVSSCASSALDLNALWPVKGSGTLLKEAREVGSFHALKLGTTVAVEVRDASGPLVVIEADDNVLPLIETQIRDGALVIEDKRPFRASRAKVTVFAAALESIATTGSVAVHAKGLVGPKLALSIGGSSAVSLEALVAQTLSVDIGGSGALRASGAVNELRATMGGSAALQAGDLQARAATVSSAGSAQSVVWATETLDASLAGSSGLRHYGSARVQSATAGSSFIKHMGQHPGR